MVACCKQCPPDSLHASTLQASWEKYNSPSAAARQDIPLDFVSSHWQPVIRVMTEEGRYDTCLLRLGLEREFWSSTAFYDVKEENPFAIVRDLRLVLYAVIFAGTPGEVKISEYSLQPSGIYDAILVTLPSSDSRSTQVPATFREVYTLPHGAQGQLAPCPPAVVPLPPAVVPLVTIQQLWVLLGLPDIFRADGPAHVIQADRLARVIRANMRSALLAPLIAACYLVQRARPEEHQRRALAQHVVCCASESTKCDFVSRSYKVVAQGGFNLWRKDDHIQKLKRKQINLVAQWQSILCTLDCLNDACFHPLGVRMMNTACLDGLPLHYLLTPAAVRPVLECKCLNTDIYKEVSAILDYLAGKSSMCGSR